MAMEEREKANESHCAGGGRIDAQRNQSAQLDFISINSGGDFSIRTN
jgi:hypothetical protein